MEPVTANSEAAGTARVASSHATSSNRKFKKLFSRDPKITKVRKTIRAAIPSDLRRSRIGKFAFIAVAIGACVFCVYQVVKLSTKYLSFEAEPVISALAENQPVNFSLTVVDVSFRDSWFAREYVKYLLETRHVPIVYQGRTITDENDSKLNNLIARYFNYHRSDELCVPSPNPIITENFYHNSTFDYDGEDFQSYLTKVKAMLDTERKDVASIKMGDYSLDTFPWVSYYEAFVGHSMIKHGYRNEAPSPGCEKKDVPLVVKAERNNFVRITYTLPKLSCIPCWFDMNAEHFRNETLFLSAGTASTKPLSGIQVRPSMAESVEFMSPGHTYTFAAHTHVVKRQSRFCNREINSENDCKSACLLKKISKNRAEKHRKNYHDAFEPRAFSRNPDDPIAPHQGIYAENLCSVGNQKKLSEIGIGKEFQEEKMDAEENCEIHCHDCTACRMACSETRVTLHSPGQPESLTKPDGTPSTEIKAQVVASIHEVLLTKFKVGYTFSLFASDVGGMVKLTATIIGCVSLAAILYRCIMMRRRAQAEAEAEEAAAREGVDAKKAKKKVTEAVMDLF